MNQSKYMTGEHFKGKAHSGERFSNAVKYFMATKGLTKDHATRLAAYIARKKYGKSAGRV